MGGARDGEEETVRGAGEEEGRDAVWDAGGEEGVPEEGKVCRHFKVSCFTDPQRPAATAAALYFLFTTSSSALRQHHHQRRSASKSTIYPASIHVLTVLQPTLKEGNRCH